MKRAQVLTPWVGDGLSKATARRPQLADDFALADWSDATGQPSENLPTSPNLFVVEVLVADATLAAIEASPAYGDGVLWSEDA